MGRNALLNLAVGAAMTIVVGFAAGPGWPAWVMGAVLAASLALGVGVQVSHDARALFDVRPRTYALGATISVVVGLLLAGGETSAFWSVGVVLAIAVSPYAAEAVDP